MKTSKKKVSKKPSEKSPKEHNPLYGLSLEEAIRKVASPDLRISK